MAIVLMAIASFACGFAVAWVFVWSAATSAMSRQSDRNSAQVSELNAQLRSLTEVADETTNNDLRGVGPAT
ncbi:hypothetical protein J4H86_23550 [Spiractinospora alimapuensis]|uniref:hypothetical protein n=1 Tax=Spiractinospora alimapuensis TaxID=2820884 RepID=UPI001F330250|nr:hypothetical protein [Spiractinospora alimapuensis]QVQ51711.1 hypothetical protein J4H86_23550 [Spiractinospora alimapuensis]